MEEGWVGVSGGKFTPTTTTEAEVTITAGEREPPAAGEESTDEAAVTTTPTLPTHGNVWGSNDGDDPAVQALFEVNPLSASMEAEVNKTVGAWEEELQQGQIRR